MSWNRDKRTADVVSILKRLLTAIDQTTAAGTIRTEVQDDTSAVLEFCDGAYFLVVGEPMRVKSIVEGRTCMGYSVGYYKFHHGTRWEPDEVQDVETLATLDPYAAVAEAGRLIVQGIVDTIADYDSQEAESE